MKILVVCGNGLGSSFIAEMNVKKALAELGIEATVSHTDLTTAKSEAADYYIGTPEIVDLLEDGTRRIIRLVNLFNVAEIKKVLQQHLEV
ncbi:PTS sugar transporter subunit IIB [Salirhabdus salicampi]|uniref:PTS sugar transporter subunit IIB n=1 Tax=Salirhabdus salicampi TaxID=476102 RepID=UPI0020C5A6AB|nr:PTS sugar transporter subunit IIB [Salirhabdus salicampi]MCP8615902.1 PTS sugar transporter subunit IIB [Salirhabdus salicampi]